MIEPSEVNARDIKTLESRGKKSGKAIPLTDTRRIFMFPAQDHQHF